VYEYKIIVFHQDNIGLIHDGRQHIYQGIWTYGIPPSTSSVFTRKNSTLGNGLSNADKESRGNYLLIYEGYMDTTTTIHWFLVPHKYKEGPRRTG
jgi:hypothetical protein